MRVRVTNTHSRPCRLLSACCNDFNCCTRRCGCGHTIRREQRQTSYHCTRQVLSPNLPVTASPSMFAALRHRDFRWLWVGTFCSTAGQWVQNATLGWVTYEVTGSGTMLGAVLGMRALPMLLLAPLAGVVADRYDRRRTLAFTQILIAAASFTLAALLASNSVQVWHLFAFTFCSGAGATFDRTLRSTLVF